MHLEYSSAGVSNEVVRHGVGEQEAAETGSRPEELVRNDFHGRAGEVVQAQDINGSVHFHHVRVIVTGGSGVLSALLRDGHPVPESDPPLNMAGSTLRAAEESIAQRIGEIGGDGRESGARPPGLLPPGSDPGALRGTGPEHPVDGHRNHQRPPEIEPRTLLLDGVDEASEPEAVLRDLLAPLARRGLRLVLGFRRDSSAALRVARELWPDQDADPVVLRTRLELLARAVDELADRELALHRHRARVAARIADVPAIQDRAVRLRFVVSGLWRHDPLMPSRERAERLGRAESDVEHASHRLRERRGELDALLEARDDLRGLLEAYRARAIDHGLVEDVVLDEPYRRSHDALWHGICDLVVAEELVRGYGTAVRERIGPA